MTTKSISMTPQDAASIAEPAVPEPVLLDYINSDSAAEIDMGIRDTIKGIRLSILAMGIGLAKIKLKCLYLNLGCKTMSQYIKRLCDDTKMDRSTVFNWLYAGEAYLKYQCELEKIGFSDNDGPTKLVFLERALLANKKRVVFNNIKNMTLRDFISFAKGNVIEMEETGEKWEVTMRGNSVYINGMLGITISKKLDSRVGEYYKKLIAIASDALEKEGLLMTVRMRNHRDFKRLYPRVEKLIREMGIG